MESTWQPLARLKQQQQLSSIPTAWLLSDPPAADQKDVTGVIQACGLLSLRELKIIETGAHDIEVLLNKLASAEWSAVDVTLAYYKAAIIAHQVTNCLTEIYIERAVAWATELDGHLARTGRTVGPLHGLPISLKDQFAIKGLDTVMGYTAWIGKPADKNCLLVDLLLQAGAIPFVRTNVPQSLMWPETFNLVHGRTLNPHNRLLTSGGSSGGEGALLALKGSPLGIGTDIGGSIRIPSAACGVYGLRPSSRRIPYRGVKQSLEGQDAIPSVVGPMSSTIKGLVLFMRAVLAKRPWLFDPLVICKAWDQDAYDLADHGSGGKLCFGFLWDDGNCKPLPPLWRAMNHAKKALLCAGHTVIDWEARYHSELLVTGRGIVRADGGRDILDALKPTGEPLIMTMLPADQQCIDRNVPPGCPSASDASDLWKLHARLTELRQNYLDYWNSSAKRTGTGRPIDAIIMPVAPFPAPPHGTYRVASYTNVWNTLDYPACVVPVTRVDPVLDVGARPHEFRSDDDKAIFEMYTRPDVFENAPVCLQVVGRTCEDEAVLRMSEILDSAVKAYVDGATI